MDAFVNVELPLARRGFITAAILVFAHTVGEFGVVLMIGGAIPKQTEVLSIKIYEFVEASQYADAHRLAGGMLVFAFLVVLATLLVGRGLGRLRT
jgi:molybdate transport system permease protein